MDGEQTMRIARYRQAARVLDQVADDEAVEPEDAAFHAACAAFSAASAALTEDDRLLIDVLDEETA